MGVAELIDRNVKCGEEGVHVNHEESVPFPSGSGSKPTLKGGHLPLKFPTGNSHQAFKGEKHAHDFAPARSADHEVRPSHRPATPLVRGRGGVGCARWYARLRHPG